MMLQPLSPRSLVYHKELMKRTLGQPTYAFEARQYVVSGMPASECVGTKNTVASLVFKCVFFLCGKVISTKRLFVVNTKEASVVCLGIDHTEESEQR